MPSPPPNPPPPPENPPPLQLPPPPPPPVVRKFPAPCWTQDETLALIHSYQDKWYSLRRRNLRTADWEAVADEVNRRCPDQSPPKSSAQCRHKMEKLRKRYRTEKQRIGSLPGHNNFVGSRFFPPSSWVFFDLMDAMEVGPGSGPGSGSGATTIVNPTPNNNSNNNNNNVNLQNQVLQNGVFVKEEKVRGKDDLGKYFDEILMGMGKGGNGAPIKFKVKNQNDRFFDEYGVVNNNNNNGMRGNFVSSGYNSNSNNNKRKLGGERYGIGIGEDSASASASKMMYLNGGNSKKGMAARGRGRDGGAGEMVASIKMLGEALVRTEKEKMEMMQEMEMKWMDMEMKRTQMILEAQHNIVNAFVQGFKKQKKVKVMELQ